MTKEHITDKRCVLCDTHYPMEQEELTCPRCGVEGILDVGYDYDYIRPRFLESLQQTARQDLFRYDLLLPLDRAGQRPLLPVGPSPLYTTKRLGAHLGLSKLRVKDDGRLPTASFKDRASTIAIARAQELGISLISAASTGNAAASLAGLTAPEGITSVIFVPKTAPKAKIAQLLTFGAQVYTVEGTYDDAFALSLEAAQRFGWYSRSTAVNPLLSEGKKTGALELCEQYGFNTPPDSVFVSVGDGCIIGGLAKGFMDLFALGIIPKMPRLIGVQAEGSKVIYEAFHSGTETIHPVPATTRADSISVAFPRDWVKALRGVKATGGTMVKVSDEEIFAAGRLLGTYAGVFAEPAGATAMAGLLALRQRGEIGDRDRVAVYVTGSGLKDVEGAAMAAPTAHLLPKGDEGLTLLSRTYSL